MAHNGPTQWVLTVAFVVTGLLYASRVVSASGSPVRRRDRIGDALHVLMSVAMIPMLWSWGLAVPTLAYVVIFAAAALWFVWDAVRAFGGSGLGTAGHVHHFGAASSWYHAGMMASMVWMAIAMAAMSQPVTGAVSAGSTGGGMASMPGMGDPPSSGATSISMSMGAVPPWVTMSSLVLGVAYFVATAWMIISHVRPRAGRSARPSSATAVVAGVVMAVGMGVAFINMT